MVVQKSDLKTWTNSRGSGKLFNVTLMDDTVSIKKLLNFQNFNSAKQYYIYGEHLKYNRVRFEQLLLTNKQKSM